DLHLSAASHVLREADVRTTYLEVAVIHILHSTGGPPGSADYLEGLKGLLGDHGVRLFDVERKFSRLERDVSGTIGDVYSRLSGGKIPDAKE
ncbi:MAG TPA: hypothetical protein VGP88_01685, partial [Thermoplasmata archaeon]|nr:hypothetical protein [Thermoplasmata archaeon]